MRMWNDMGKKKFSVVVCIAEQRAIPWPNFLAFHDLFLSIAYSFLDIIAIGKRLSVRKIHLVH